MLIFFPSSVVRSFKMDEIKTRNNVQSKDTGQLPVEIDGFLRDKDRHFKNCMWLKQLVMNSGNCEVNIRFL